MTVASFPQGRMEKDDSIQTHEEGGREGREKKKDREDGRREREKDAVPDLVKSVDGANERKERNKRRHRRKKLFMEPSEEEDGYSKVPTVTIEGATPSPRPPSRLPDENNNREDGNEDNDNDDDSDDDEDFAEEEQTEEGEEEEKEMTIEEKRDMYLAVQSGDIDLLEDCLDQPNSDVTMTWFRENLLMTAIREGHSEMAEFLLDNGVDHTYSTSVVGLRESSKGKCLDRYEISCRQMAYDREMFHIVELIDLLQNQLFPFVRPLERTPRFRRPKPPTPSDSDSGSRSEGEGQGHDSSGTGSQSDTEGSGSEGKSLRTRNRKKRRGKRKKKVSGGGREGVGDRADECDLNKTGGTGSMFGEGTEVDSGHHSLGSSKLRIAMVREHERLTEKEENLPSSESAPSPRRPTSESEKGDKSLVDQSEKSETTGSHIRDEGYGSISQKSPTPCPSPEMKPLWTPVEPSNRFRSTKSALAVRNVNLVNLRVNNIQPSDFTKLSPSMSQCRPLRWRKISTIGSYANESKNWHVKNEAKEDDVCVEISQISLAPPTTSSTLSGLQRQAPMGNTGSKSPALYGTSSELKTSFVRTEKSTESNPTMSNNIASYMRPTKSTITKQRLTPNFVKSYGGLEFTHVIDSRNTGQAAKVKTSAPATKPSRVHGFGLAVPHITPSSVIQRRNNPLSFRS
ncbi:uncharacterized protein LOC101845809 [Aplysia californica]|uniref:Uncharacterized protein LOC101845809 n=1 Tax=Aplysia californica TaxID=6500 RepID=A0ABM0K7N7_APLCA|nr:uncharacterized protein LOC101845809 [Aplysia californica]